MLNVGSVNTKKIDGWIKIIDQFLAVGDSGFLSDFVNKRTEAVIEFGSRSDIFLWGNRHGKIEAMQSREAVLGIGSCLNLDHPFVKASLEGSSDAYSKEMLLNAKHFGLSEL
jgi:hypothetical protein